MTFADFTASSEADIEDMFGADFYLSLVNSEYAADLVTPIKSNMLSSTTPRMVPKLEGFFQANPPKTGIQFNHYRPARYFAENVTTLSSAIPQIALDRFEAAFKALNALL